MKYNIPLSVPNLSDDILPMIKECIDTGWVSTGGRFITEFEELTANFTGVKKAVGVQSGTAALHLAYLLSGVKPGIEVIVPAVTFISTVNPVMYTGGSPVFMDCDDTLNMDLNKLEDFLKNETVRTPEGLKNKHTGNIIKVLTVVHIFGNPIDMEKVMNIAEHYDLTVIEDAAESLGSFYASGKYAGRHTGTIGDMGIFSFNANKTITTGGGGMFISKHDKLLEKARFLSVQAKTDPLYYRHDEVGFNYRLTNIAAAFGVSQIRHLPEFLKIKKQNFHLYKKLLSEIEGLKLLDFNEGTNPNYWFYSVIVDEKNFGLTRDQLLKSTIEKGIQTRPLWGLVNKQKPYKKFYAHKIEKAEYYEKNLLNIPCSTNLKNEDIMNVVNLFKELKRK